MLEVNMVDIAPDMYLRSAGEVFAVFDTQDSGNISYRVRVGDRRYFVKTAGRVDDPLPVLSHPERVALMRNAIELARTGHPTLPALHRVIESPAGPMLVYDWFDGELLHARREHRDDPASPYQRFRALSVERVRVLPSATAGRDNGGTTRASATTGGTTRATRQPTGRQRYRSVSSAIFRKICTASSG